MDFVYPENPLNVPNDLTIPTKNQKRNLWLSVAGLVGFAIVYIAIATWFTWATFYLVSEGFHSRNSNLFTFISALASGMISFFMIKALFFVKKGEISQEYEVKEESEPKLFRFLYRLADETGAPRPHRVFLSSRVNACVFYDLSILNFFFPSKKNLEIGLGLVNVLTISELKAVLAHEFGHFAQRSMALGNWVYIAQQMAAHIIARRDALDDFLKSWSYTDPRLAWIFWILRLAIWSLRASLESIFNLVLIAQHALSREMEFQADLVAVSVTGSDALIHALHKLQAADSTWDSAQNFFYRQAQEYKAAANIFNVHLRTIDHMGRILNDPGFCRVAILPDTNPSEHRVFTTDIAQPPKMWATHPYNHERENNAKRRYIPAKLDDRESWVIFDNPEELKANFMKKLLLNFPEEVSTDEGLLGKLDEEYQQEYLNSKYRGAYLGRSFTLYAEKPENFLDHKIESLSKTLGELYPPSLSEDLEKLRNMERELGLLSALKDGFLVPPDGIIRFRGNEIRKRELPKVIESIREEYEQVLGKVSEHDKLCHSAFFQAAKEIGKGWPEYLSGLLEVLHYADHSRADVDDARGLLNNVYAVVTADRDVSSRELDRLVKAGTELFNALEIVFRNAEKIELDSVLLERLGVDSWASGLGKFGFVPPTRENMNEWLKVVDSWIDLTYNSLSQLRYTSLEELLNVEAKILNWTLDKKAKVEPAPKASVPVKDYPKLTPGKERKLQRRLGLWDRFQTADGFIPGLLRFSASSAIIGGIFYSTVHWILVL
ncbi:MULTISPECIES: M48 family metallopeptidase [unclassified Leptospira]|uniref:M48 family metallopeptidase n=1 Tax=unclassified Leptospira TaxID=2633828 RepID=UPI0002BF2780|nr:MULTISPECIES: M48 family metallopeptidase [unclassified Leptospira]EMK01347.1 peptidase, M48 family [Leptospira sp. B5-022]MCR1794949.1 M48 family metalloprotease [Leptospira sp. id769339]